MENPDGVALVSAEHPLNPENVKYVAEAIAKIGCGPDFNLRVAEAAIRADMAWQAANEPGDIDPAALETIEIEIKEREEKRASILRGPDAE